MQQMGFSFLRNYKKEWGGKEFGGSLLQGKRKTKRPLSTKHPLHLILKSSANRFFTPHNRSLENLIRHQAKKFGIKILDLSLNWSHIHLLIKLEQRESYIQFIRSLTAIIAERIRQRFPELDCVFDLRPYSRIVTWGRDLKRCFDYIKLNKMEAEGLVKRIKIKNSKGQVIKEKRVYLEFR